MNTLEVIDRPPIERVVIFNNPASRRAAESERYIGRLVTGLRDDNIKVERLATEFNNDINTANIEATLEERDAVALVGGDGTVTQIATSLLESGKPNPTITLLGGSINDIAHMLHTGRMLTNPAKILEHGRVAALRPLTITATNPNSTKSHEYAFAYWSMGASANTGRQATEPNFREKLAGIEAGRLGNVRSLVYQSLMALSELRKSSPLTVQYDDGSIKKLVELNVPNGEREAQVLRFPVCLLEDKAGIIDIKRGTITGLATSQIGAFCGQLRKIGVLDTIKFKVENDDGQIPTQHDGEFTAQPSGTTFSIGLADHSVNVFTTRR